ncbi:ThuA domain-containing protein [Saccharibacillus sp. CPCC 101409]|uniref:ThuA domain-containing protein n=1 Tax=Saccharibacillus sp. CPCC 101409 TaxID=3058041 RepID=UPI00267147C8|nr:ThuA domain-containing protein [Saccharibacillus sp. CPCC 101409]MDO3411102.1 ThuA domain-containing protein [Saccharibacillus sp. CPCC 101409]
MNVWAICGDRWHPADTVRGGLKELDGEEFSFKITDRVQDFDPEELEAYPVVLVCRSNRQSPEEEEFWMSGRVQKAFEHYVERGGSLLAVHAGTAGYEEDEPFRRLLGGAFIRHPEACEVTVNPEKQHPIAQGVEPFPVHDEHYFMEWEDPVSDLIMTTVSEHGAQPGGWTRTYGRGRVCVLTPGHEPEVWTHPMFLRLLRNALYWCAKRDPAEQGV